MIDPFKVERFQYCEKIPEREDSLLIHDLTTSRGERPDEVVISRSDRSLPPNHRIKEIHFG